MVNNDLKMLKSFQNEMESAGLQMKRIQSQNYTKVKIKKARTRTIE